MSKCLPTETVQHIFVKRSMNSLVERGFLKQKHQSHPSCLSYVPIREGDCAPECPHTESNQRGHVGLTGNQTFMGSWGAAPTWGVHTQRLEWSKVNFRDTNWSSLQRRGTEAEGWCLSPQEGMAAPITLGSYPWALAPLQGQRRVQHCLLSASSSAIFPNAPVMFGKPGVVWGHLLLRDLRAAGGEAIFLGSHLPTSSSGQGKDHLPEDPAPLSPPSSSLPNKGRGSLNPNRLPVEAGVSLVSPEDPEHILQTWVQQTCGIFRRIFFLLKSVPPLPSTV